MPDFLQKNFALVLAFVLPMLLIVLVALSTYLPSLFLSTDYNFLYASCTNGRDPYPYRCDDYLQRRFTVTDGRLSVHTVDGTVDTDKDGVPDSNDQYTERIFFHDTAKNESREITLAEAQAMTLNTLLTSPDGVTVSSHYDRGGGDFFLFFGGRSSYGYSLTKGRARSKLNLINNDDQYYYQNNFHFLGWVTPGRNS
ncbi:MAG: hypothetical protein PHU04_01520 [Candidatus Peribacteraceae bacterium]|nr:hypothetical protein [Candidatus Peribacteraceae bacterium]